MPSVCSARSKFILCAKAKSHFWSLLFFTVFAGFTLVQAQHATLAQNAVAEPPAANTEDGKTEAASTETDESPGMDKLDEAFELKINSKTTRDLDKVARLCEEAMKKGLEPDAKEQAKILAKTAYYEHAQQLAGRIFVVGQKPDPRWKSLRRESLLRLEKAVDLDPEMASAYVMMARLQTLPSGDRKKGKEAIEKALSMIQGDDELMSDALIAKVRLSDDILADSTMSDVDEAIRLNPENRQARGLRSQLLMKAGKLEEALEDVDAVLESANSYDAYAAQADQMIKNPEFPKSEIMQKAALRYLDKAMEIKKAPKLFLAKALVYQTMNQPEKAIAEIDNNLEVDPKNYRALMLRSAINTEQEKIDDAISDLDKALELKPDDLTALSRRMLLSATNDDNAKAIADCKRLNELSENNFELQMQLAQLYLGDDQPSQAIKVIDEALEQYEDGVWEDRSPQAGYQLAMRRLRALRLRGDCNLNSGDHADAIDDYELGLDLTEVISGFKREIPRPDPPKIPQNLPEELKKQALDRWETMVEELDSDYPGDSGLLNNLAWVLATSTFDELRDGERAIELATDSAEITEYKMPHILSTLAAGYAEAGEFEQAKEWIRKGIEVNQADIKEAKQNEKLDDSQREALVKSYEEQQESLQKELASYEKGEPWRERQISKKEGEPGSDGDDKQDASEETTDGENDTPAEADDQSESDDADAPEADETTDTDSF